MATTIQISEELQTELNKKKLFGRETYEEVIKDLMEDSMELSDETKLEIEKSRAEIKAGKYKTLSQAKKELGL
ncbi:Uncharacterised protein [uncultured archaeon]|nr:Uncharacterised protein [uncultured archaeon]